MRAIETAVLWDWCVCESCVLGCVGVCWGCGGPCFCCCRCRCPRRCRSRGEPGVARCVGCASDCGGCAGCGGVLCFPCECASACDVPCAVSGLCVWRGCVLCLLPCGVVAFLLFCRVAQPLGHRQLPRCFISHSWETAVLFLPELTRVSSWSRRKVTMRRPEDTTTGASL